MVYRLIQEGGALLTFVGDALLRNWWLIALSVAMAVVVELTETGDRIRRAFLKNRATSILLAAAFGAFSPLCSCSVIPMVIGLLHGGVPLAPIMTFWIASPSMDPEMFFLSVAALGWPIAITRLVTTIVMSLGAGYLTCFVESIGWIGNPLRAQGGSVTGFDTENGSCDVSSVGSDSTCACPQRSPVVPRRTTLVWSAGRAAGVILRVVIPAFILQAVIVRYLPQEAIVSFVGARSVLGPLWATVAGVPLYTSTMAALGLTAGLVDQGMSPGSALAFLIAGPVTTLPAMAAVFPMVRPRVFTLYLAVPVLTALAVGYGVEVLGG